MQPCYSYVAYNRLSDQRHEAIVLRILYHMSMDDRCKSMFTYTECVPMAMSMLLDSSEEEANLELIALCINLAINKRNAQMMVENNRLQSLMTRAFRNQDSLLMKMLRNIAQHDSTKQSFVEFVGDIAKAIGDCENEDFVVECVGVLGNMTLPDLDFSQLMQRFNLIPWIFNVLVPSRRDDDLVLEVVVFLGTAAADEGCATLLCKADVLLSLIELLKGKKSRPLCEVSSTIPFRPSVPCTVSGNTFLLPFLNRLQRCGEVREVGSVDRPWEELYPTDGWLAPVE
uniref:Uncharacterized protein n=1 Tax=Timema douglasi TaxID=61478 RepID=A0A7R8ZF67_TIMDO|nr:unnamed protein product [Timema douglasi]